MVHCSDGERSCADTCGNGPALVLRTERRKEDDNLAIHYELITSDNMLMKDAEVWDFLVAEKDVLALRVLAWIVYSKRQLSTEELQEAFAVQLYKPKLDSDLITPVKRLQSVCAELVTIDKEGGVIRLVHYTTQEFFERTKRFPEADKYITTICVRYLQFKMFESGQCSTDEELEERLRLHKLYDYAAHNWGHHARECSPLLGEVSAFLESVTGIEAASQPAMQGSTLDMPERSPVCQRFESGPHHTS